MSTNITQVSLPPAYLDSFGRQRVSSPQTIFDSKLLVDNAPLFWDDQQVSGAGTSSTYNANQASVTLAVSGGVAGRRLRQTFRRFSYQPGKSQLFFMTGILGNPAANIISRIGEYSDANGMYFEASGTSVKVVTLTSTTGAPTPVPTDQASWNIDKMDGTGPSGQTVDWTKTQIFVFDYEWLGVGSQRFGLVLNGQIYYVHQKNNANVLSVVYMSSPNLPLRYEIINLGAGPAASLTQICSTVISEGGRQRTGFDRSVDRGVTGLTTNNDANNYPVLAIRLNPAQLSTQVIPTAINLLCSSAATFRWSILLNPTFVGAAPVFNNVAQSSVQAATTTTGATTVTGGIQVASGYQVAGTDVTLEVPLITDLQLGSTIAGVPDVFVLAAQRIVGTTETFLGSISWNETP